MEIEAKAIIGAIFWTLGALFIVAQIYFELTAEEKIPDLLNDSEEKLK